MADFNQGDLFNNRYRLLQFIGEGGSAQVWKVADTEADNYVEALKIYAPHGKVDERSLQMFLSEYKRTRHLRNDYLLKPNHYGVFEGKPFLVMDYCEKGSLEGRLEKGGALTSREVVHIMLDVVPALHYLHTEGILHLDIKPANILQLGTNYLLADFGISVNFKHTVQQVTQSETSLTLAYGAPEVFNKLPPHTPKADVFSVGVTMFELITNQVPWNGMGGAVITRDNGMTTPDIPVAGILDSELNLLIKKCVVFEEASRLSVVDLIAELRRLDKLNNEPIPMQRPQGGRVTQKLEYVQRAQQENIHPSQPGGRPTRAINYTNDPGDWGGFDPSKPIVSVEKKSGNSSLVVGVMGVLLLLAIGGGAYWWFTKDIGKAAITPVVSLSFSASQPCSVQIDGKEVLSGYQPGTPAIITLSQDQVKLTAMTSSGLKVDTQLTFTSANGSFYAQFKKPQTIPTQPIRDTTPVEEPVTSNDSKTPGQGNPKPNTAIIPAPVGIESFLNTLINTNHTVNSRFQFLETYKKQYTQQFSPGGKVMLMSNGVTTESFNPEQYFVRLLNKRLSQIKIVDQVESGGKIERLQISEY